LPRSGGEGKLPGHQLLPHLVSTPNYGNYDDPAEIEIYDQMLGETDFAAEHAAGGVRARFGRDPHDLYLNFEEEVEVNVGLPPTSTPMRFLSIGYPIGRFGPVRRVPLAEVVYEDQWSQPYRDH
jgi:hypothetical protein